MWKKGYTTTLNKLTIISCFLCGKAIALPQDWPCEEFIVEKNQITEQSATDTTYLYKGQTGNYFLEIELTQDKNFPALFADCGTHGCPGTLKELTSKRQENINFFCETIIENDYNKIKCFAGGGDEYLLTKATDNIYQTKICSSENSHTIQLDLSTCNQCHCILSYYDKNNIKQAGTWSMNCTRESPTQIRCFTSDGYTAWRNYDYINATQDFQNCIDLTL
ncbi:MAG: hypothetical protein J6J35_04175 [Alphaproteobacteria bacterium]|nr:hypothetical protein [Alphaproteobacteria bacterium]